MAYNNYVIDVSVLKSYLDMLTEEKKNFNKNYNNLHNSYLSNCTDEIIINMLNNLDKSYIEINNYYSNIINWLNYYINDSKELELYLSGEEKIGKIKSVVIRNFIKCKLPNDILNKKIRIK